MSTEQKWIYITGRRAVSIAGRVTDALTHAPIAQAVVEMVAHPGQTTTQPDGIFYFLDLPAASYRLRVSVPSQGRRYGVTETASIPVSGEREENGRIHVDYQDVALAPTRIHGHITEQNATHPDERKPIVGAKVQLMGDPDVVLTNSAGYYQFTHLVARRPRLQVSAPNFAAAISAPVILTPGADHVVDMALNPR